MSRLPRNLRYLRWILRLFWPLLGIKEQLHVGVICKVPFGSMAKLQSLIQLKRFPPPSAWDWLRFRSGSGEGDCVGSFANSCPSLHSLCFFRLLWGQGRGSKEQEGETGEVKKVRRSYGAWVVFTTETSSVRAAVQTLLLSHEGLLSALVCQQ